MREKDGAINYRATAVVVYRFEPNFCDQVKQVYYRLLFYQRSRENMFL